MMQETGNSNEEQGNIWEIPSPDSGLLIPDYLFLIHKPIFQ